MKDQYLVGIKEKGYIRLYDGNFIIGCSRELDEIQGIVDRHHDKKLKVFKLIEVKQCE